MWVEYNPNPEVSRVGDCTVRAISKAMNQDWTKTYLDLCTYGLLCHDMPSSNAVWGKYLSDNGYKRYVVSEKCPACYNLADFAKDNPKGTYIMAISGHVVCLQNGDWYDTWDSGSESPVYYWKKE